MRSRFAVLLVAASLVMVGCLSAPTPGTPTRGESPGPEPSPTESPLTGEPTDGTPMEKTSTERTPTKRTPTESTPVEQTPTEDVTPTSTGTPTSTPGSLSPPDPATDRLGWEGGRWHNESIAVRRSDGLNASELAAVVNRSMARVELIRRLEFERRVPTEVISRAEYRSRTGNRTPSQATRLHQNVKWEAMFMVGEDESALGAQQSTLGSTIAGYYSPSRNRIVIVSGDTTSPNVDETTLAHELVHALQDYYFNISRYESPTRELHNARDGLIEGDANYVQRRYEERCGPRWECLLPRSGGGGGGSTSSIHWGIYLVIYQPYSDGPPFVRGLRAQGGWESVNAAYDRPPASTEQTIHPEKYPEDDPVDRLTVESSPGGWYVLDLEGGIDYASFGEAGLATMLFYPYYHSDQTASPVVSPQEFFNVTASGSLSAVDPINYSTRYTAGWDGDWLYPHVNATSFGTNETGYVWKTAWDSPAEAREFQRGYRMLLEYYGAEPVEGRPNTYRIREPSPYADAFRIVRQGSSLTIVNAPTVEDLSDVYANARS